MDTASLEESLLTLARNHRWTWSRPTQLIFAELPGHEPDRHPVQTVRALDDIQLDALLDDTSLVEQINRQVAEVRELITDHPQLHIAYFSPEFGISELVPQYSGGLGILAGDHLKAASDLDARLGAVGLFYREGFFQQELADGRQGERYERYEPTDLGCVDTGKTIRIPFPGREVLARIWRLDVGRVPLLLLDTDVEENEPSDRRITDRLYSGDARHRLEQEMVLGAGGARALDAMAWHVPVHHLNEGHAGFLLLELLDRRIHAGRDLTSARNAIRPGVLFTTHTPVPAGIDRFDLDLASEYLAPWAERWSESLEDVLALGINPTAETPRFNMAAFCLQAAGRANGVSRVHGRVSRNLFAGVPGGEAITSITNGVHARTWVMPRLQGVFDDVLGPDWTSGDQKPWADVDDIPDETIRTVRRGGGEDLRALVAERTGATVDPDALIIGFARRFATYKRATLLLQRPDELGQILGDHDRPVVFVFAGKAHPADEAGKALLADVVAYGATPAANGRFLFVAGYDMAVARAMYAGCDVWLNNPIRPREASGTSGEKSALNGGLNLSISDGWWDEMADGRNGWTIPASEADGEARDLDEATSTLQLLRDEVVPEYYGDGGPWSRAWLDRIRHGWRTLGPKVTAARMVGEYRDQLYEPALREVARR